MDGTDMDGAVQAVEEAPKVGTFHASLVRNNKKIRDDRAMEILEAAQLTYKRAVEDLELSIKKMERDRRGLLDLSPTDAQSLVMASDFNENEYTSKDINLGIKIYNAKLKLQVARIQYVELFGDA